MTMHTDHHGHGLSDSLGGQLALFTVALIAVLVIAWFYVF